ncbi:PilN domain-containing protein, partial [Candidatus Saccharibacteria bacterium]|nr:PilN domain-containing protein [Candidatus Saccharibacteria bacterium]
NKDVESIKSELEGNEELTRMLSVQGQIAALPALYNQRPEVTRLSEYIAKTTPPSINLSKYSLDFEAGTIEITGTGESVSAVNKYVDVLRFAKFRYKVSDGEDYSPLDNAFTDVVLTSFSKDTSSETAGKSNFTASFKFNAMIFDALQIVDLQVPQATTTHNQEAGIFSGTAVEGTGQGGN